MRSEECGMQVEPIKYNKQSFERYFINALNNCGHDQMKAAM